MKIGILGGGQLGRMLALSGYRLGMQFRVFDPAPDACAGVVAEHIQCRFDDRDALDRFASGLDAVTYEFENVPVDAVEYLATRVSTAPSSSALEITQDRLLEKDLLRAFGLATADFRAFDDLSGARRAADEVGFPCVFKARRFGYDGKSQAVVNSVDALESTWRQIGGAPSIVEALIPFQREMSLIVARDSLGNVECSPWIENQHDAGILRVSRVSAEPIEHPECDHTVSRVVELMNSLEYVGVMAVEFFESSGHFLANEIAPRVHNSGHWTIDGAPTSQFENHLRAIAALPLGSMLPIGPSGMVNLIGTTPSLEALLHVPRARVHLYGKQPRPGRKLGHVTIVAPTAEERDKALDQVQRLIESPILEAEPDHASGSN